MLLKYGGIAIVEGSGKLNGTVFFKGRSGAMARVNVKGVNPRTLSQMGRRAQLSAWAQAWRGLTPAQRSSWNSAAASGAFGQTNRLGVKYNPTGSQLYVKLNLNSALMGGVAMTVPPLKSVLPEIKPALLTVAAATADVEIVYTGTLGADDYLIFKATGGFSPGVSRPGQSRYRFIETSQAVTTVNISLKYADVYGPMVVGQKIFVSIEVGNNTTGTVSRVGTLSSIVV